MKVRSNKEKFGDRLRLALENAKLDHLKTSDIATKFNLRHPIEPVTQQAVYKWINGLSIPSADKIETLAKWLNVTLEWLHYGVSDQELLENLSALDNAMIELFIPLSDEQKKLVIALLRNLKISP